MPDPQGKRRCGHCNFFERETKGGKEREATYGFCHRYAPRAAEKQYHTYWPVVASDHWCGEFFIGKHS
ncbi:MAG: hypothetical protein ACYS76_01870 [Planctomycetota bacterium]